MNNKIIKIITILIFVLSAYNIIVPVIKNSAKYTERFNPAVYEKKYNNSQYVIPQSKNPISDEELLSYAGYKYATGLSPILINSDHPPFGKYIIGWFILLTGNNRIVSLVFGLAVIILTTSIIFKLTRSIFLVSLGTLMISVDTVFLDQLIYSPLLDIIQVFFLLLSIHLFITWVESKQNRHMILLGLAIGAFSSTKIYFPAIVFFLTTLLFLFIIKKPIKSIIIYFIYILITAFIVYLLSYSSIFFHGGSLRAFFGAQKWIFLFWSENSIDKAKYFANIIPLLLFNQWKVWWGTKQYIQFIHWSIFWPIFFISGLVATSAIIAKFTKKILKKSKKTIAIIDVQEAFIALWVIISLVYLLFIPISPRYLMILYIPMYITITIIVKKVFRNYV